MLEGTWAQKRPWNVMKLQGAFFPSATANKLITPRSLDEEDKSSNYSGWGMTGLIFSWKELLLYCEETCWAAWSHSHIDGEASEGAHITGFKLFPLSSVWHQIFSFLYQFFFWRLNTMIEFQQEKIIKLTQQLFPDLVQVRAKIWLMIFLK